MRIVTMPRRFRLHLTGALASAVLAAGMTAAPGWDVAASAVGITTSCGPGVELRNCPPLCSKLLTAVTVSKIFHVSLGKADWHLYGEPQDTCTYAEVADHNSTVTDSVDSHETLADYNNQVKVTKQFNPKSIVQSIPALGKDAIDIVHCIGSGASAWCYPNIVAFSKGYLVQAGEALDTVNLAEMDKIYVPKMVAWVKALFAKA
jgi:hypothetical protein